METVTQELNTESKETRTFTQDELDAIVSDRLKRERSKYSDYEELKTKAAKFDETEEANKTELQKQTERADSLQKMLDDMTKAENVRKIREKVSTDTGVPFALLSGETDEDCRSQAEAILAFAKPEAPKVKDGGNIYNKVSSETTRDVFAEWLTENIKK